MAPTKRIAKKDWRLLVLVLAQGVGIAGFVSTDVATAPVELGGWREIDRELLMDKIRSGDLVQHEADWYRVVPEHSGQLDSRPGP